MFFTRGISLISLLISLALVGIVTTLSMRSFVEYGARQALLTDVGQVVSVLREARERTIQSDERSQYGVRVFATSTHLFKGSVYTAEKVEGVYTYSPQIAATTTLGSSGEVLFSRLTGTVVPEGNVILYLRSSTTTIRTIAVYGSGLVSTE